MADRTFPDLRRFPDLEGKTCLICVGAAKCATSWLHGHLATSPHVTLSPLKELHFFNSRVTRHALGDVDALAMARLGYNLERARGHPSELRTRDTFQASVDRVQMIYDDNAYFAHFSRLCTDKTRIICDITPAYSVLGTQGFDLMRSFCASQGLTLKLLFVMRDPITRLWSQLRHMQQLNPENDVLKMWPKALETSKILAKADYKDTVTALDQTVDARDVLYLFYEDLFSPASSHALSEFIGSGPLSLDTDRVANETQVKLEMPDAAKQGFADTLSEQYAFCRSRFGAQIPDNWAQF